MTEAGKQPLKGFLTKTIFVIMATVLLLNLFALSVAALEIDAKSVILLDASSGRVLFEQNANEQLPPASLTKIMTALLVLENKKLTDRVTLPKDFVNVGEASAGLAPNETRLVESLLYYLLLRSANDAAQALALGVSGNEADFAKLMNARAKELGLVNTNFVNPHGLNDDKHYSTAADLAAITRAAMKYDVFNQITAAQEKTVPWGTGTSTKTLQNLNQFLTTYEGATGTKTGYTKQAGSCLIATVKRGDTILLGVILNSKTMYSQMALLMDYGFANYENVLMAAKDKVVGTVKVSGGREATVDLTVADDVFLLRAVGVKKEPTMVLDIPDSLTAPMEAGTVVGIVSYTDSEGNVAVGEITIAKSIEKYSFGVVLQDVLKSVFNSWVK